MSLLCGSSCIALEASNLSCCNQDEVRRLQKFKVSPVVLMEVYRDVIAKTFSISI